MESLELALPARYIIQRDVDSTAIPACSAPDSSSDYFGLRVGSVFIILVTSAFGAILPIWLARTSRMHVPKLCFFVAKYFGSGVILATAFMHLLAPAQDELGDPCLTGILGDYDWAPGIALMTVMVMFFIELMVSRFGMGFGHSHGHDHGNGEIGKVSTDPSLDLLVASDQSRRPKDLEAAGSNHDALAKEPALENTEGAAPLAGFINPNPDNIPGLPNDVSYPPGGEDHLGHHRDHVEGDSHAAFAAQMTALFILEFGVIFHSIFIGLTLAVSDNFIILFIVIIFHQTFEGLGLGSRLATASWPRDRRRWMPYLLGLLYAISTPLAIGIGITVRQSLNNNPTTSQLVNGIFDAISAGILLYTGLVELLAHEFMFNPQMRKAGVGIQLFAYSCVATGCGLMALLAKWA